MLDIFRIQQSFPDDLDIRIVFHRQNPAFALNGVEPTAGKSYRVVFTRANLCYTRLRMKPNENIYSKVGPVLTYPFTSLDSKYIIIPSGTSTISLDIISGIIPTYIILLMIDQNAFMGKLSLNPHEFKHNNPTVIFLRKNYNISIPGEPFTAGHVAEQVDAPTSADPNAKTTVDKMVDYARLYVSVIVFAGFFMPRIRDHSPVQDSTK